MRDLPLHKHTLSVFIALESLGIAQIGDNVQYFDEAPAKRICSLS